MVESLITISSTSTLVVLNTIVMEFLTGVKPGEIVLVGDDEGVGREQCRAVERIARAWVGGCRCRFHRAELTEWGGWRSIGVESGSVVVDLTPGRKLQALKLYLTAVERGWGSRYILVSDERRFGYRLFGEACLDRFRVYSLDESEFISYKRIDVASSKRDYSRVKSRTIGYTINIALTGDSKLKLDWRSNTYIKATCSGEGECTVRVEDWGEENIIEWSMIASGAQEPEGMKACIDGIARALEEGEYIVYDTNSYINGIPLIVEERIPKHLRSLHRIQCIRTPTVFNELSRFEKYKTSITPEATPKLHGLCVWSKVTPGEPGWMHDGVGDNSLLKDLSRIRKTTGRQVTLVTFDAGLAERARALGYNIQLLSLPEPKSEVRVEKEVLSRLIIYSIMGLGYGNVRVESKNLGVNELRLKYKPVRGYESLMLCGGEEYTLKLLKAVEETCNVESQYKSQ